MDIEYFLKVKCEENRVEGVLRTTELYKNIENKYLKHLFAVMHQGFNGLLNFMQMKKKSNGHYNAAESRELLQLINLYEDVEYTLKSTPLAFRLEEKYVDILKRCCDFLQESGGTAIISDI